MTEKIQRFWVIAKSWTVTPVLNCLLQILHHMIEVTPDLPTLCMLPDLHSAVPHWSTVYFCSLVLCLNLSPIQWDMWVSPILGAIIIVHHFPTVHLFCHMEASSTGCFTHVGSITLILAQLPQYLLHTSGQSQVSHLESIPPKLYPTCLERHHPPSHLVLLITLLENFCFINKLFIFVLAVKIDFKWGYFWPQENIMQCLVILFVVTGLGWGSYHCIEWVEASC